MKTSYRWTDLPLQIVPRCNVTTIGDKATIAVAKFIEAFASWEFTNLYEG